MDGRCLCWSAAGIPGQSGNPSPEVVTIARTCHLALIVTLLVLSGTAVATPPLLAQRPFATGESLQYRIRLGPLVVGSATLTIVGLQRCGDRTVYEVRSTTASNGLLRALYPVRDRIVSWADTLDFRSHRLCKQIREGPYRERSDVRLDHERGVASGRDGVEVPIPVGCHDVYSALLRLRASALAPGTTLRVPVLLGAAASTLRVEAGPRRIVKVPAGEFPCIELQPQLGDEGPFRHEGPVRIDLSEGPRHLPVRIRMRVPVVGQLSVELVELTVLATDSGPE